MLDRVLAVLWPLLAQLQVQKGFCFMDSKEMSLSVPPCSHGALPGACKSKILPPLGAGVVPLS